jgi:hypothetical protein
MGIDIEIVDGESHLDGSFEMSWKRTGISPFLKKTVVEMDPFFELRKVCPSPHFPKELSFIKFERFALLKIGAVLDRTDPKGEPGKALTVGICDGEGDFSLHRRFLTLVSSRINNNPNECQDRFERNWLEEHFRLR